MVDPPCASWRIHHGTRFCLGRGPRPLVGSGPVPKPKVKRGDDGSVRGRIVRLWRLVEALHGAPRGMSNAQLMRRIGGSRATLYRDLTVLKAAGVPVVTDTVNSEARHRLEHGDMPALNPTPLQLFALGHSEI